MQNSDVAFTIVVNRQADEDDPGQAEDEQDPDRDNTRMEVDFVQEAVQEAIQEAVQDAVQEVQEFLVHWFAVYYVRCMLWHRHVQIACGCTAAASLQTVAIISVEWHDTLSCHATHSLATAAFYSEL